MLGEAQQHCVGLGVGSSTHAARHVHLRLSNSCVPLLQGANRTLTTELPPTPCFPQV